MSAQNLNAGAGMRHSSETRPGFHCWLSLTLASRDTLQEAAGMSQAFRVPANHTGHWEWVLGPWLQPGPAMVSLYGQAGNRICLLPVPTS